MSYEHKTYPTARVELEAGSYSRKDIEGILKWFDTMDAALKRSMQPATPSTAEETSAR